MINSDVDSLFKIKKIASKRGLIEIHHDLPNLAKLMINADLAIGAEVQLHGKDAVWGCQALLLMQIIKN